jgi:chaperone BCS1
VDIYVISLLEPTLTESDLQQLFNNLPKRCIVLLEDIDTAGLVREDKPEDSRSENEYDKVSPSRGNGRRAAPRRNTVEMETTSNGISLSGLLNAIDGVASHEGRVLIMTSNFPEKLDPALIRPGRVDMQVAFTLATKLQIKEIFIKMYASDPKRFNSTNDEEANAASAPTKYKAIATKRVFSREELQPLAENFAKYLPEGKFSPAEVQNFLITRKKDPTQALEEIESWRDEMLDSKEKKSRIITVM